MGLFCTMATPPGTRGMRACLGQGRTTRTDIACPTCGEHLGMARARDGFTAQWWADKTIQEHEAEYHD